MNILNILLSDYYYLEPIVAILICVFTIGSIIFLAIFIPTLISRLNYYPSLTIEVDITNKRIPDSNEALDYYIFTYGIERLVKHIEYINMWKKAQLVRFDDRPNKIRRIQKRWLKNEYKAFGFSFYRIKTRYRQYNYVKSSYKVEEEEFSFHLSETAILKRIKFLESHNYSVSFNQYTRKDQRRALTPKMREMIKLRDNYTCQICGKYMPDEVGLHIDHIIPVSKGGKSVPENLRVLCSKCNGRKGNS